jgi:4-amino-4-deoxy-L-arabinose transferase-like glycosyltransferase
VESVEVEQSISDNTQSAGAAGRFLVSGWAIVPVVVLAAALLSIGFGRDYRLKHEDNNALHATFGRAHVEAGLRVTKGHDAYINWKNRRAHFYAHHPPGCGLVLAAVFTVTGSDRPEVVRGVAIAATLATLVLLWWIVRREAGPEPALVAAFAVAVVPQAAFYGRMVNHEVLALPFIVLLVDRYFALVRGGGVSAAVGLTLAATAGALVAWVTFFALAACMVHAAVALRRADAYPAAGRALIICAVLGAALFSLDIAHIAWVKGGDLSDLLKIFSSRIGAGQTYGPFDWAHKMFSFSRRLATASGTIALIWIAVRTICALLGEMSLTPVEEYTAVFSAGGLGYLVMFNWGAWQHHYWQFPLLPAVAIALALAVTRVGARAREGPRRVAYRVLLGLVILEVLTASTVGLYERHNTPEERVIQAVEKLRSRYL